MRTYAEDMNHEPFDWNAALKGLRTGSPAKNQGLLYQLSSEWPTCACGNLCSDLPRNIDAEPCESELLSLGISFHEAVDSLDWNHARAVLARIESRSAELIAEMGVSA